MLYRYYDAPTMRGGPQNYAPPPGGGDPAMIAGWDMNTAGFFAEADLLGASNKIQHLHLPTSASLPLVYSSDPHEAALKHATEAALKHAYPFSFPPFSCLYLPNEGRF